MTRYISTLLDVDGVSSWLCTRICLETIQAPLSLLIISNIMPPIFFFLDPELSVLHHPVFSSRIVSNTPILTSSSSNIRHNCWRKRFKRWVTFNCKQLRTHRLLNQLKLRVPFAHGGGGFAKMGRRQHRSHHQTMTIDVFDICT